MGPAGGIIIVMFQGAGKVFFLSSGRVVVGLSRDGVGGAKERKEPLSEDGGG